MKPDRIIRIIKSADRSKQHNVAANSVEKTESARPARREVAANVADWVKEFRQRRRPDPRRAFAGLFGEPASSLTPLS